MKSHLSTLLLVSILLTTMSCAKLVSTELDCTAAMLNKYNMTKYENQDLGCAFYLELYQYNNKQYFVKGNDCAELERVPVDCQGNNLCANKNSADCQNFFSKAKKVGIVGVGNDNYLEK